MVECKQRWGHLDDRDEVQVVAGGARGLHEPRAPRLPKELALVVPHTRHLLHDEGGRLDEGQRPVVLGTSRTSSPGLRLAAAAGIGVGSGAGSGDGSGSGSGSQAGLEHSHANWP